MLFKKIEIKRKALPFEERFQLFSSATEIIFRLLFERLVPSFHWQ
jgi:hypothetical protein